MIRCWCVIGKANRIFFNNATIYYNKHVPCGQRRRNIFPPTNCLYKPTEHTKSHIPVIRPQTIYISHTWRNSHTFSQQTPLVLSRTLWLTWYTHPLWRMQLPPKGITYLYLFIHVYIWLGHEYVAYRYNSTGIVSVFNGLVLRGRVLLEFSPDSTKKAVRKR